MDNTKEILLSQRFSPEIGGSIEWMNQVYRRWYQPVDVITHRYPGTSSEEKDNNLRIHRHDIKLDDWGFDRPGRVIRYLRMTLAVLRKSIGSRNVRIHCTHAVPEVFSVIPLKLLFWKKIRIICYAHGEEITGCESSRQLRFFLKIAYKFSNIIIANSEHTASLVREYEALNKVHVIHPGVGISDYKDAEERGRKWLFKSNISKEVMVILTVGRLQSRKNHQVIIRALAELKEHFPRVLYLVAGEGEERIALEKLSKKLHVTQMVRFLGLVDEDTKVALYGACDIFAMPSVVSEEDFEGFGMVFIEAGACRKPSIAGVSGGQGEAVIAGRTGLILDGNNLGEVVEGLRELLSDRELRETMGKAARQRAEELSWDDVVKRTRDIVSVES